MGIETHLHTPLAEAVRRAGGQSPFGRLIGRKQSTVFDWLRFAKPLPAELAITVERETGVSRHDLRPDIYPVDTSSVADAEISDGATIVAFDHDDVSKRSAA